MIQRYRKFININLVQQDATIQGIENVKHIKLFQMFPNRCLAVVIEHLYRYVTLPRYITVKFYGYSTGNKVC
jgi:hypothetical protein